MAAKGSRLRFELGRVEVAGVVVSTAAGLFVVFLLGIYAGRGMAERRLEIDDEIVRLPVDTEKVAAEDADELTFYETLAREEAAPEATAPESELPERIEQVVSAAALDEEDLPARPEPPRAEPERKPERTAERTPESAAPPPPAPEARVAVALVAKPAAEPDAAVPPPAVGGDWSVQVAATRDPRHAESIKRQLTTAGYRTYIVKTRRQGETFHRVRVGQYPSLDEARVAASLLRRQPRVTGAFVASD